MTDEDLIVRLREIDGWVISSPHVHLWAKRLVDDAVAEERDKLEAEARAEQLVAKCERLEAALRGLMVHEPDYPDTIWQEARSALEGTEHE